MKRHWVEYHERWVQGPMSFWVHRPADRKPWYDSKQFDPPVKPVPGRGYPHYCVEVNGFVFRFASLAKLSVCISTLGKKHLPSTDRQTQDLGTGPGKHWLNKLPAEVKPWRYREKAVAYLKKALSESRTNVTPDRTAFDPSRRDWRGIIRALNHPVQFERDPVDGVDHVIQIVVDNKHLWHRAQAGMQQ